MIPVNSREELEKNREKVKQEWMKHATTWNCNGKECNICHEYVIILKDIDNSISRLEQE